jgi:type II secretory pathway pseudopilin PulG
MRNERKRGFTLAELIVTAAITVIVIGAAAAIMITGLNIFNKSTETAREQREIRLAETALKENLVTALSYNETTSDALETGDADINLYFNGGEFVMYIGTTMITASDITSIAIDFVAAPDAEVCSAQYVIRTKGIEHSGVIVMNNIKLIPEGAESCDLLPNTTKVLHMTIPKEEN